VELRPTLSKTIFAPMVMRTSLSEKKYWMSMNMLTKAIIAVIPAP
jgi:hypothetical protein